MCQRPRRRADGRHKYDNVVESENSRGFFFFFPSQTLLPFWVRDVRTVRNPTKAEMQRRSTSSEVTALHLPVSTESCGGGFSFTFMQAAGRLALSAAPLSFFSRLLHASKKSLCGILF